MAFSTTPNFATVPWHNDESISTAETSRTAPTALATLKTASSAGSLVTAVEATAQGTTTAGVLRLFISDDGGTTKRLYEEVLVSAFTPSTTVAVWSGRFRRMSLAKPLILTPTNGVLYVATNNAEGFTVHAEGGDFVP